MSVSAAGETNGIESSCHSIQEKLKDSSNAEFKTIKKSLNISRTTFDTLSREDLSLKRGDLTNYKFLEFRQAILNSISKKGNDVVVGGLGIGLITHVLNRVKKVKSTSLMLTSVASYFTGVSGGGYYVYKMKYSGDPDRLAEVRYNAEIKRLFEDTQGQASDFDRDQAFKHFQVAYYIGCQQNPTEQSPMRQIDMDAIRRNLKVYSSMLDSKSPPKLIAAAAQRHIESNSITPRENTLTRKTKAKGNRI